MDDRLKITLLLDFYGGLLTKKQFEMLDLHYNNDYSLAEVASEYNITRQGAFDNIKRGKASLFELEDKLKLVEKFTSQKRKAKLVLEYMQQLDTSRLDEESMKYLDKIKEEITGLLE